MLCDECKKRNAVVHMTKSINGVKEEINLCEVCAKGREGGGIEHHFSIPNFLAGLLESNIHPQININYQSGGSCQRCGTSFNQFKQRGRLGCDECYEVFREKITPLIRRVHGSTGHIGKVPQRTGGTIKLKRQVKQLKVKLKEAIEREAFEEAAKIRDEIKGIEKEINEV
ncbi:UvrB/UvrC motif-containing protein [Alkaliphilus transvaalensis]|uniref:UvrB/UvrC motif-containing protein n=1 Tax=Alkaliphilus transvaalensis TaxID=114628 RepID=UPI00047EFDB4|nr:UvrB/UvrC motif-containing protein [Alkaliphilus transvaalensis]